MKDAWERKMKDELQLAKRRMRIVKHDKKLESELKCFAILNHGSEMVPIMPRHMKSNDWRSIFWLQPKRVVINGSAFSSLCDACMNAIPCLQNGRGHDPTFQCKAKRELIVPLRKEKKGGDA